MLASLLDSSDCYRLLALGINHGSAIVRKPHPLIRSILSAAETAKNLHPLKNTRYTVSLYMYMHVGVTLTNHRLSVDYTTLLSLVRASAYVRVTLTVHILSMDYPYPTPPCHSICICTCKSSTHIVRGYPLPPCQNIRVCLSIRTCIASFPGLSGGEGKALGLLHECEMRTT